MKFAILGAVAALAAAQPAAAAIYQVTSTGTLKNGFDQTGMFGAANSDLTGAVYSVVEYFDTDLAKLSLSGNVLYGGADTDSPPQIGHGVLTVNGVSIAIAGTDFAYLSSPTGGSSSGYLLNQTQTSTLEVTYELIVKADGHGPIAPLATLPNWSGDCLGVDFCGGGFSFSSVSLNPGGGSTVNWQNLGYFDGETFDVRVVSGGVPEPATWAMMIVGFGLVGSALRRRMVAAA
jgi:hypothetical protein